MKKLLCLLFIAVLLFALNGCTQTRTRDENNTGSGMPNIKWFETKEEIATFNETIEESDWVPENFVKPDEWTAIGELEFFGFSTRQYSLRHIIVYVKDANGIKISLHMSYGESYSPYGNAQLSVTDGMASMQYLETSQSGSVERCGVLYVYDNGWLSDITFYLDDIRINMSASGCTSENPYPEDQQETFYKKLLSLSDEEVMEAIRELKTSVGIRKDNRKWLIPTGIGVGVVALGATGFVVWKKKKRKAANKPESPEPQPVDTPQQT